MKKLIVAIFLIFICISPAWSENITLPWTRDFSATDSVSVAAWLVNGATASRVAESWRGGGDYCAKLTPPTTGYSGVGTDGGYSALGRYIFSATSTINISFAIKVGTTFDQTAVAGSGIQNKFIDVTTASSTRAGLLLMNKRANPHFVWALWQLPTATNFYSDGSTTVGIDDWGASPNQITFYNGTGGALDYAGRWLWVNYIITPTQERIYVYDREGTRSGLYFQISSTPEGNADAFYIGGYYNHSHPGADANTYIMLDDLSVNTSSTPQSPPAGFVTGVDTTPPVIDNLSPSGVQACTSNPRNVTLSLTTNENATARMATTDIAYSSMTDTFTTTGGTSHNEVKSLACGASYTYYVRASDSSGNANTSSSAISFSIASPQIAGPGGLRITGGRLTN